MLGASVSFLLILILVGFSIFKAYNLFKLVNPDISKVSLMRDMSDGTIFKPQEYGFDFAFGLTTDLDPRMGHFTVKQFGIYTTNQTDSSGKNIKNKTSRELKFQKCSDQYFTYPDQKEVVSKGIHNYNCIPQKDDF